MTKPRPRPTTPTIRCAVYTRKSTDEGLDLDFNSLDAQRESGEAYIKSQAQEGWVCLPDRYDDGGFTGGNMDRPALKRLLADIQEELLYLPAIERGRAPLTIMQLQPIAGELDWKRQRAMWRELRKG